MIAEIRTILCPTSLGPTWEKVFGYAMGLAQRYDANVIVVYGIEPLSDMTKVWVDQMLEGGTVDKIRSEGVVKLHQQIQERIERFCQTDMADDPKALSRVAGVRVDEGFPSEMILKEAETADADLIVMGTHDHTMLGELLGSVAHKVVHRSSIPVFLVPLRSEKS